MLSASRGGAAWGVGRLICQTGAMIGAYPRNRTWPFQLMAWLFNRQRPLQAEDRAEQERLVIKSGLHWTIIKPPRLTNRDPTGNYKAGPDIRVELLSSISRADLSMFIVKEIVSPTHVGKIVFILGQ